MDIRPIHNDNDHRAALREIEALMDAKPGSEAFDKLDILATLVERYERERFPIAEPRWDPVDVIQFAIDEMGHSQKELGDLLGSRSRASEILKRRRPLTVGMIHAISTAWKIPASLLIKPYAVRLARVALV
jgi:HTH-type transcriptional regulator / antitoxin HigA